MGGGYLMGAVVVLAVALAAEAQLHHVVGGDRGWEPSTDVAGWSAGRVFRVGDKIWFTFSGASESVLELGSKEEFEYCDLRNPIRMYTDGLLQLDLDQEGIRYFASGGAGSCKKGLKLHVNVEPQWAAAGLTVPEKTEQGRAMAAGPTPSASNPSSQTGWLIMSLFPLALVCLVGF